MVWSSGGKRGSCIFLQAEDTKFRGEKSKVTRFSPTCVPIFFIFFFVCVGVSSRRSFSYVEEFILSPLHSPPPALTAAAKKTRNFEFKRGRRTNGRGGLEEIWEERALLFQHESRRGSRIFFVSPSCINKVMLYKEKRSPRHYF